MLQTADIRKAPILDNLRQDAFKMRPPGLILEFGVYHQSSIRGMAKLAPDEQIYGFDAFTKGLPYAWFKSEEALDKGKTSWPVGHFKQPKVPEPAAPNITLIDGYFADTLPAFFAEHDGPIGFIHIDCDIYESTRDALEHCWLRLQKGTVIVFDELRNWKSDKSYQLWYLHEWRAFDEMQQRNEWQFEAIGRDTSERAAIRVLPG